MTEEEKRPQRKDYWAGHTKENDTERYIYGLNQFIDRLEAKLKKADEQVNKALEKQRTLHDVKNAGKFAEGYLNGKRDTLDEIEKSLPSDGEIDAIFHFNDRQIVAKYRNKTQEVINKLREK